MNDESLVQMAIEAMNKAITFKSNVGAVILTIDGSLFTGFNIETYIHKGYHAEEVALISALKAGYSKRDIIAIAIAYSFAGSYPACASCRQMLWEFTNPELRIIFYDVSSNSGSAVRLVDVYPLPYPDWSKKDGRTNVKSYQRELLLEVPKVEEKTIKSIDTTEQGSVSEDVQNKG